MTPHKVLIVDDEPLARSAIRRLLQRESDMLVVGEAADGRSALDALRELSPDIVFLDVQMPEMTGIEVLEQLRQYPGQLAVIFTTAYDEYAIKAFELHAIDYLMKPYRDSRFHGALERARQRLSHRTVATLMGDIERVMETLRRPAAAAAAPGRPVASERLVVKINGDFNFIGLDEIRWIEGHGDYLKLHCKSGAPLIRDTFKELQQRLDPARFVRVHKSAMVNSDYVRKMRPAKSGDYEVELVDGTKLRVSRIYKSALEQFV